MSGWLGGCVHPCTNRFIFPSLCRPQCLVLTPYRDFCSRPQDRRRRLASDPGPAAGRACAGAGDPLPPKPAPASAAKVRAAADKRVGGGGTCYENRAAAEAMAREGMATEEEETAAAAETMEDSPTGIAGLGERVAALVRRGSGTAWDGLCGRMAALEEEAAAVEQALVTVRANCEEVRRRAVGVHGSWGA